jgi:predicted nucleic acid-binding protein
VFIPDTGMFCGEIVRSCRGGGQITSLLWAIHFDGAQLYLPKRVVEEVVERLHRRAPDEQTYELAKRRFASYYLSQAVVVDEIPESWGQNDPRIQALAVRDPTDLPAARLSVALGACLLAEDPDLVELGLADSKWLVIAHAAANDAEYTLALTGAYLPSAAAIELGKATWRGFSRAPAALQVVLVAGLLLAGYWLVTSGRGREIAKRVGPRLAELGDTLLPPVAEIMERGRKAEVVLGAGGLSPSPRPSVGELVAGVLARSGSQSSPMLAGDIARQLGGPPLRERTRIVRAELLDHPKTFIQVSRGRFALGRPVGGSPSSLPTEEITDFLRRSHKDAKPMARVGQAEWNPDATTQPV